MNRYEKENAINTISGYYLPRPHETALGKKADAFERAKQETIDNLRKALANVEAISADEYFSQIKKVGISTKIVNPGITYRQYLIAHAPEKIPTDFKPKMPPKLTPPEAEDYLSPEQIAEWENTDDITQLSGAVREFDTLWNNTLQQIEEQQALAETPHHALWPIAWADAIIEHESRELYEHAESAQ